MDTWRCSEGGQWALEWRNGFCCSFLVPVHDGEKYSCNEFMFPSGREWIFSPWNQRSHNLDSRMHCFKQTCDMRAKSHNRNTSQEWSIVPKSKQSKQEPQLLEGRDRGANRAKAAIKRNGHYDTEGAGRDSWPHSRAPKWVHSVRVTINSA